MFKSRRTNDGGSRERGKIRNGIKAINISKRRNT